MIADIRDLLVRLNRERQTGLLSLVIEGGRDAEGQESTKEALSLSFVGGELAAAEARDCQGMTAMLHLARSQKLLRQRWYPVSSNVLKRMDGMPVLAEWIERVEAEDRTQTAGAGSRAQRLDDILRVFHSMGGVDGIERFVTLTGQHPPESDWNALMLALRRELTLYFGPDRATELTQT